MLRYGYDRRIAYGVVAAGGTLGILIPPSGPMILYGITTDTSIGGLFIAGIVRGPIMALVFIAWAVFQCSRAPAHIQRDPRASREASVPYMRKEKWSFADPVLVLVGV